MIGICWLNKASLFATAKVFAVPTRHTVISLVMC